MNELSLFTGVGGGLLGTKLLGFNHIGYVEINDYCQRIIKQRIDDGILDRAPIFGDIKTFINDGYAASYTGLVDVITAGFPCQPFSVAGRRKGADDKRNLWPETARSIQLIKPRQVFLENVPGIKRYLPVVYGALRRIGYCVHPRGRVAAASLGAGHLRWRDWIFAHNHSARKLQQKRVNKDIRGWIGDCHKAISGNTFGAGFEDIERCCKNKKCDRIAPISTADRGIVRPPYWETEPCVGRVASGVPYAMDRLKALGNGQVPIVAKTAWELLTQ